MKPIFQTILTPPHGNCLQASIASILELELDDVPNFMLEDDDNWRKAYLDFMALHDLQPLFLDIAALRKHDPDWVPVGWHLLAGISPRSKKKPHYHHELVCYRGVPIHDPSPLGNCTLRTAEFWTVFISSLGFRLEEGKT